MSFILLNLNITAMNWIVIHVCKDGGKRYSHKFRRMISEELKNGKMLVYDDTYNIYYRNTEIVTKVVWESM